MSDTKTSLVEEFVEIKLPDSENFLKVKETLTRIGVASSQSKELFQSCHILHKKGRYFIVHFKELFELDGKESNFSDEDKARRNTIANLLAEWGLVDLVNTDRSKAPVAPLSKIKVLSFKEKDEWKLTPKYHVGKKKLEGEKVGA
jgi:hypothetical protein